MARQPDLVAVIVPAMKRPHNAAPFMSSLNNSCVHARAYFICDRNDPDEIDAALEAGAGVIVNNRNDPRFSIKVNIGYRQTREPWLLFVGDDVQFHPAWYEHALAASDKGAPFGFPFVATNDMFNQAVLKGMHATHPLIRRDWIDRHGASFDGPGTVAHEGYRHWYVDNEWTEVAKRDHAFVYAPDSIVEHFHPYAAKADTDEVYELGQSYAAADQKLWHKRQIRFIDV